MHHRIGKEISYGLSNGAARVLASLRKKVFRTSSVSFFFMMGRVVSSSTLE